MCVSAINARALSQYTMTRFSRSRTRLMNAVKNYNVLEEVDLIDDSISSTFDYWAFRANRILPATILLHAKANVSLVLNTMQVLILTTFIRQNGGDLMGVNTFLLMLPTYVQLTLKLVLQLVGFGLAAENAYKKESNHPIFNLYHELSAAVPVLEHIVPVLTYAVFLVCAISIGGCHLNNSDNSSTNSRNWEFCRNMDLEVVEGLIGTATVILVIHNLLSIYTHSRHCSVLNPKTRYDGVELRTSGNQLDQVAERLDHSMNWWKFRLSRIFSSNVTNNCLQAIDHGVEGIQVVLLVRAFNEAQGNLHNVHNWSRVLLPLQLCFYLKFAVVIVMLCYVAIHTLRESRLKILIHLREPKGWLQIAEYFLPLVAFLTFGLVTTVFAKCMTNTSASACKAFSWDLTEMLIIVVSLVQFLYHVRAIHNVHSHTSESKRKDPTEVKSQCEAASTAY